LKKIYRILIKKLIFYFNVILSKLIQKLEFKIIPSYTEIKKFNFNYSKKTRRLIYNNTSNSFSKLIIDTSHYQTDLCKLGSKFGTNKSPLNKDGHRSGFTPYYDHLFNHLRNKKINFAEIGIEKNASTKMWREYFSKARIYGFEYEIDKIINAKKHKLKKTIYKKIDVNDSSNIKKTFSKLNKKFDIIIDDSTHYFDHQINIIKNVHTSIKKDGFLIIEDIHKYRKGYTEDDYYNKINDYKKFFKKIFFVEIFNVNNYTASWKNEKLLVFIKK
jgi:SAM-dependent methyltransferase